MFKKRIDGSPLDVGPEETTISPRAKSYMVSIGEHGS